MEVLVLGGVLAGVVSWWRRAAALKPPQIPAEWRARGAVDRRLREALDLWDRLFKLARTTQRGGLDLLRDLFEVLSGIEALGRLEADVADYLAAARSAPTPELMPETQTEAVEALDGRRLSLGVEADSALEGLRQVYLHLLEGEGAHGEGAHGEGAAGGRARDVLDRLRAQSAAEGEIRAHMSAVSRKSAG